MNKKFILLGLFFYTSIFCSYPRKVTNLFHDLVVHNMEETLDKIVEIISRKEKGVYFRFADGEIEVAHGRDSAHQKRNKRLAKELKEALLINCPNVMKASRLNCKELGGYVKGMFPGNLETSLDWCINLLKKSEKLWGGPIKDVYQTHFLHYYAQFRPEECMRFLKFLKENNCYLLIGNNKIPEDVRKTLLGNDCKFVPTPVVNAYNQIDRIERECLEKVPNDGEYKIIVTAMGVSGKALQKRLWKKLDNVFLFDFGSLIDGLCDFKELRRGTYQKPRAWLRYGKFDGLKFFSTLSDYLSR